MSKFPVIVDVHETTIQKVAREKIELALREKRRVKRSRNSRVEIRCWSDGVHPLIVQHVLANGIHHSHITVIDRETIIIKVR